MYTILEKRQSNFSDLDGNTHEITTFDHSYVSDILSGG